MIDKIDVEVINSLTMSELYVLRFMDKHKAETINSSVQELSDMTFVSTATVMRLAKKLGYTGFAELKYSLKQDLEEERELQKKGSESSHIEINKSLLATVEQTSDNLDMDLVCEVVKLLESEKNIHMFAKGLTSNVFEYATKQLQTAKRQIHLYNDTHIAYINGERFTENDVVFLASLSGRTHQVVRMGLIASSRGATVITITGRGENELSKLGDINFKVANERVGTSKHDFSTRLAMMYLMDVIIGIYLDR